jgi:hypothetical protein
MAVGCWTPAWPSKRVVSAAGRPFDSHLRLPACRRPSPSMVLSSARRSAFLYRPSSLQMRQIASQLSVSAARANIAAREEGPAGVHAFSFLASSASVLRSISSP